MPFPITITISADGTVSVGDPPPANVRSIVVAIEAKRKAVYPYAAVAIDRQQSIGGVWYNGCRTAAARAQNAEGPISGTAGAVIQALDLPLIQSGAIPASTSIWVEIQSDASGHPSGTVLARSADIEARTVDQVGTGPWAHFIFPTPVAPAGSYHIVLRGDYPISATNFVLWGGTVADSFAGALARQSIDGVTWNAAATWGTTYAVQDHGFKVFVAATVGCIEPDPPFTFHLVSGTIDAGDGFSGALTRDAGDAPGVYTIRQGTLSLDPAKYALSVIAANLTIVAVPTPTQSGMAIALAGQSNAVNGAAAIGAWTHVAITSSVSGQAIQNWDVGGANWPALAAALASTSIAAFVWWQGESDAGPGLVDVYAAKLRDLIARVRAIKGATLPVVLVGIGPACPSFLEPHRTTIHEIQRTIGADPHNTFVETAAIDYNGGQHCTDPDGYRDAAYRIAEALGATSV